MTIVTDRELGPRVDPSIRAFDFTLVFEHSILTAVPWVVFCIYGLISIVYAKRSWRRHVGLLFIVKAVLCFSLLGSQLALLVSWRTSSPFKTSDTLTALSIALCGSLVLSGVVLLDHLHDRRHCIILGLFLLYFVLVEATKTRTLWLMRSMSAYAAVQSAITAIMLAIMFTQEIPRSQTGKERHAPEDRLGPWSRMFFVWLVPLFASGYRKDIGISEVPKLPEPLNTASLAHEFGIAWERRKPGERLAWVAFKCLRSMVLAGIFPRLMVILFNVAQPLLLKKTLVVFGKSQSSATVAEVNGLVGAYFLVYVGYALAYSYAQHQAYRFVAAIQSGLISMIHQKSLRIAAGNSDDRAPLTLMSTDIERIEYGGRFIHELWASIIEVAINSYVLASTIGVGAAPSVCIVFMFIVLTAMVGGRVDAPSKAWVAGVEKRVNITSSLIDQLKNLKVLGLESYVSAIMQRLRVEEVYLSRPVKAIFIWCQAFSIAAINLGPPFGFLTYSLIRASQGKGMMFADSFTALSLMTNVGTSAYYFMVSLPSILAALSCVSRIEAFLLTQDAEPRHQRPDSCPRSRFSWDGSGTELQNIPFSNKYAADGPVITVRDASFRWLGSDKPQLRDVNVSIPRGTLCGVVGPVGSGKSTLLHAILAEVETVHGNLEVDASGIAFCAQVPWLMNGSIRSNILGGAPFKIDIYRQVLYVCALEDLDDATVIGSSGSSLSGGQKQRVALARALYAFKPVILLDDSLSGLDRTTTAKVVQRLFVDRQLCENTTIVYATSDVNHLAHADNVIVLSSDGSAAAFDSPAAVLPTLTKDIYGDITLEEPEQSSDAKSLLSQHEDEGETNDLGVATAKSGGDLFFYLKSFGWRTVLVMTLAFLYAFCLSFPSMLIKWWTADSNASFGMYIGIYFMLGSLAVGAYFSAQWVWMITLRQISAEQLHLILAEALTGVSIRWLEGRDVGQIQNRFSQDMEKVDMELPDLTLMVMLEGMSVIVQLALFGVGGRWLSATIPVVIAFFLVFQRIYLHTSRRLRLMQMEAKSPLYAAFSDALAGPATIRAFGMEHIERQRLLHALDRAMKPLYCLYCAQRWAFLILNLCIAGLAVLLIGTAAASEALRTGGYYGVAFVNLVHTSQSVKMLMNWWIMLEIALGAVRRIRDYVDMMKDNAEPKGEIDPGLRWPDFGGVKISNICVRYKNASEPTLKNLSYTMGPRRKVGVCGSSGSGKSTLLQAICGLAPLEAGNIAMDGIDISLVNRSLLRQRLGVVTQDPAWLPSSLRFNLGPENSASDDEILNLLDEFGLRSTVERKGGLDKEMEDFSFSFGQQKLLLMVRAILRKPTIVILDEPSSGVDSDTEARMNDAVRTCFTDSTVIMVAHRLETMLDFDEVVVLDKGKVVESGPPLSLLREDGSRFKVLYEAGQTGMDRR